MTVSNFTEVLTINELRAVASSKLPDEVEGKKA